MCSGAYAIGRLSFIDPTSMAIGLVVFGILLWRHVNPALLVLAGGTIYMVLT